MSIVSINRQKSMTHSYRLSIYLDFTDSIDFYCKINLTVLPKKKTDFMQTVNLLTIELELRVKESNNFKKSYLFCKTRFKVFFGWPIIWPGFLFFPFFHHLDLLPFQNNLISACSYFLTFLSIKIEIVKNRQQSSDFIDC